MKNELSKEELENFEIEIVPNTEPQEEIVKSKPIYQILRINPNDVPK